MTIEGSMWDKKYISRILSKRGGQVRYSVRGGEAKTKRIEGGRGQKIKHGKAFVPRISNRCNPQKAGDTYSVMSNPFISHLTRKKLFYMCNRKCYKIKEKLTRLPNYRLHYIPTLSLAKVEVTILPAAAYKRWQHLEQYPRSTLYNICPWKSLHLPKKINIGP